MLIKCPNDRNVHFYERECVERCYVIQHHLSIRLISHQAYAGTLLISNCAASKVVVFLITFKLSHFMSMKAGNRLSLCGSSAKVLHGKLQAYYRLINHN